jgi:hypothetical protein
MCEIWCSHGGEDDDVLLGCDAVWTRHNPEQHRQAYNELFTIMKVE